MNAKPPTMADILLGVFFGATPNEKSSVTRQSRPANTRPTTTPPRPCQCDGARRK